METLILVIYVGVYGVRSEDIEEFVHKVTKRISPETVQGEIIVIPTQSPDTRVECINPKYITNAKLVKEHNNMMKKLHEHQLEQIKEENND